ncbi:hypothetical protein SNE40_017472 [Patella caerulea]|uniref:TIR domain-containing protein n=1 Tax=Patella caerulea TaxID=87958 RepID=A0AAN8JF45_PATCE
MAGVIPKPKLSGKKYHYCVLYNYVDGPASHRDDDQKMSRAFLAKMEQTLAACGFTDSYYFEKILPGSNLFEVYSATFIESCEKVVAILTKGFRDNCWHKYTQQTSFLKLINNDKTATFLPIVIGERREHISKDLGLDRERILYFEKKWEEDEHNWCVLTDCFLENKPIPAVFERLTSNIPVEETHDAKSLAEDGAPATRQDVPNINNSGASSGIKGAVRPLLLHGGAPATGQEVSNTNKPSGASRGTAESASIYRPVGVTMGLSRNTPTNDGNSNPTGPRGDPVGAAATGFPDLQLPSPGDIVEDRMPSTLQTNPRTSPDDTEPAEPPTDVLPGDTPSIHIRKHVLRGKGDASGSDIDNPAEQKKSPYYMDALNFMFGNF